MVALTLPKPLVVTTIACWAFPFPFILSISNSDLGLGTVGGTTNLASLAELVLFLEEANCFFASSSSIDEQKN